MPRSCCRNARLARCGSGTLPAPQERMESVFATQGDVASVLRKLIELEYDAVSAYRAAVLRLGEREARLAFEGFQADHERHIRDIAQLLRQLGANPPDGADIRQVLTVGKVVIGNLAGQRGIVTAMRSNEHDTHAAYEVALRRNDLDAAQRAVLLRAFDDERRHANWIGAHLPH